MITKPLTIVCEPCRKGLFSFFPFQIAWVSRTLLDGYSYNTTWKEIKKQSETETGCSWCRLLLSVLEDDLARLQTSGKFKVTVWFREERKTLTLGINGIPNSVFYTYTSADDPAASYITARDLVRKISSPESYRQALQCVQQCQADHARCPKVNESILPTRVVDCTDPTRPKLFLAEGANGFYVALSYVWGQSQPCTTSDNIDDRVNRGLEFVDLPQTIQDAIIATYNYGMKYLWIDALCILQDSQEDKNREIEKMRSVYRDAYITITVASARRVGEGFLHDRRDDSNASDVQIPFLCLDRRIGTVWLSPVWQQYNDAIEPVNARAWCLQERMLSPRSLIYASHTLQYACQTETINIGNGVCPPSSDFKRLPDAVFENDPPKELPNSDLEEARRSWRYAVESYSKRSMTDPGDKLVAISGIADQFHRIWPRNEYLGGLWRNTLLEDLLWFKNYEKRLPLPENYRAPSWSWAAVDGHIIPGMVGDSRLDADRYKLEDCEILSCNVLLANETLLFGPVVSGKLRLLAPLIKATWNSEAEMPKLFICLKSEKSQAQICVGHAYPDFKMDNMTEEIWAVPLRCNVEESYAVGLILIHSKETTNCFRRVGYFHSIEDYNDLSWITSDLVVVTIV